MAVTKAKAKVGNKGPCHSTIEAQLKNPRMAAVTLPSPTEWAKKYGNFLNGSHKSGLTPVNSFPAAGISAQEAEEIRRFEKIQHEEFLDFTTRELEQMDTLCIRELKEGNLPKNIIPMLRRENWENLPPQPMYSRPYQYKMPNGIEVWSAFSNDKVWEIMEPIVTLASKILLSTHLLPWFDALLDGDRQEIPRLRREEKDWHLKDLKSFHRRDTFDPAQVAIRRDETFETLTGTYKYTFAFGRHEENPETGDFNPTLPEWDGISSINYDERDLNPNAEHRAYTWLNYLHLESLLRNDLTSSERLAIQWEVANTITHEIMHVIAFLERYFFVDSMQPEPYFEEEAVAELGFSFEAAVNGGLTSPFLDKPGSPLGYWLLTKWPELPLAETKGVPAAVLKNPGPSDYQVFYPIPVSFYEDMQQNDFWDVGVRAFGHGLLHYRSLKEGTLVKYKKEEDGTRRTHGIIRQWSPGYPYKHLSESFRTKVDELHNMAQLTPDQRRALHFGKQIAISADAEVKFWENAKSQNGTVSTLLEEIELLGGGPGTAEFLETLLRFLTDAIENHLRMIVAMENTEQANNIVNIHRRKNLLAWNRGTRIFVVRLSRAGAHTSSLEFELEQGRMLLFTPAITALHDGDDWAELNTLQRASDLIEDQNTDTAHYQTLADGLLADYGTSKFARCVALILLAALRQDEVEGWEQRRAEIYNVGSFFGQLRWSARRPWEPLIRFWEEFAEILVRRNPPGS